MKNALHEEKLAKAQLKAHTSSSPKTKRPTLAYIKPNKWTIKEYLQNHLGENLDLNKVQELFCDCDIQLLLYIKLTVKIILHLSKSYTDLNILLLELLKTRRQHAKYLGCTTACLSGHSALRLHYSWTYCYHICSIFMFIFAFWICRREKSNEQFESDKRDFISRNRLKTA